MAQVRKFRLFDVNMVQLGKLRLMSFRFKGFRYPAKYVGIVWSLFFALFFCGSVVVAYQFSDTVSYITLTKILIYLFVYLLMWKYITLFVRHRWMTATLVSLTLSVIFCICGYIESHGDWTAASFNTGITFSTSGVMLVISIYCGIRWWLYMRYLCEKVALRRAIAQRRRRKVTYNA